MWREAVNVSWFLYIYTKTVAKNNLKRASAGSRTIDDIFKRKKLSEKSAVSISTQSVVPAMMKTFRALLQQQILFLLR